MSRTFDRRSLLRAGLALPLAAPFGFAALKSAFAAPTDRAKVLVKVFLRGGVDGLSVVVPHSDRRYYDLRRATAIAAPGSGKDNAAIALDGQFGLHPAMAAIEPLYREGTLGFVHAVGSHSGSRSHFDAQDELEQGGKSKRSGTGWLARAMSSKTPELFTAVSMAKDVPLSLRGVDALALGDLRKFGLRGNARVRDRLERGFSALYGAHTQDAVSNASLRALGAIDSIRKLEPQNYRPSTKYPKGAAARQFMDTAMLIKSGLGVRVSCIDVGGWDTHSGQKQRLNRNLKTLSESLLAFHRDLGPKMEDVVVMVVSEFGRTAAENGTGGTDHGHGTIMMLLGGAVAGGKVHGRWPGLGKTDLYEGRDLAVTTDYRQVMGEVAARQIGSRIFEDAGPTIGVLRT